MESSKITSKKSRGYIEDKDLTTYKKLSKTELLDLLNSDEAYKRTIAIRIINIKYEIDESLATGGVISAKTMVRYLEKIGTNQHKSLPTKKFNKKSYPLPRDIVARTLAHMDTNIFLY